MAELDNTSFIREMFSKFYSESSDKIEAPKSIENREFGFTLFKENVMVRHKSFSRAEDLRDFIRKSVPSNVYYSSAYYSMPEAKMDEKGWLGSDLFFDIDADHIPTKCNKEHDSWTCKNCGLKGKGRAPEKCPNCGNESFEEKTWPCKICLEAAKLETIKLIDILLEDLGFSADEIKCSFSGHRGYHICIESDDVLGLDTFARKEIVDYVTGTGIDVTLHGLNEVRSGGSRIITGPSLGDAGWRGRAARGTYDFLLTATIEDLRDLGLRGDVAMEIVEKRDAILESWRGSGPWRIISGLGIKSWEKIILRGLSLQSAKVDTVVTVDVHRLIRLPGTLHGKTGLLKVSFPASRIEEFDPLREAVAFKGGEVKVYVEEAPELRFGDEVFGPFERQFAALPTQAALFLLCKGAAKVVY